MKKRMMLVFTTTLLGFGSIASAATDYRHYSDKEFAGCQTRFCKAPAQERNTCRQEWQERVSECGADAREHFNRPSEGRGEFCRINGLQEWLGLNTRQSAQVKELREKQFTLVVTEKKELVALQP